MEFGKIEYKCVGHKGEDAGVRIINLTLVGLDDKDVLVNSGVRELRINRIMRLTQEAKRQGCMLGYEDLSALLLTSVSTLKRDISHLGRKGYMVPIRGRRKNGKRDKEDVRQEDGVLTGVSGTRG